MAYEKQNFVDGFPLAAAQLNHIEDGIEELEKKMSSGGNVDLEGYAKEQWVQQNYQPKGNYLTEVPEGYAKTKDIPTKTSELENDSGYLTEHQSLRDYAKKTDIPTTLPASDVSAWAKEPSKPTYTAQEVGALPSSTEIPTVPTKVSAFTNDAGYLTEHQDISALQRNPLYGKSVSFNGDSVCHGGTNYPGGYGKIIADRNNMTYQNVAQSGAAITSEVYSESGSLRGCICHMVDEMNADADYAIVEGGLNDASSHAPIGTLSVGFDAELDETTFYGAFESMLKRLITKFAGKKIGYIAVPKTNSLYDARYGATVDQGVWGVNPNYYQAALECCEKWGVPVCDLNTSVPPIGYVFDSDGVYMVDGSHPTEAGYRAFYCDQIETWMQSLVSTGKSALPTVNTHNSDSESHPDIRLLIQSLTEDLSLKSAEIAELRTMLEDMKFPSDYQKVEYIESNGTQWIDTGVLATDYPNGIDYTFNGYITSVATNFGLWGALNSGKRAGNFSFGVSSEWVQAAIGGTSNAALNSVEVTEGECNIIANKVTATGFDDTSATLNGKAFTRNEGWFTASEMPGINIYFLKMNGSSQSGAYCRVYGFTMVDSATKTTIRKFVPCYRKSDNVIGLYDTVGETFYTNIGTGEFTKGADV